MPAPFGFPLQKEILVESSPGVEPYRPVSALTRSGPALAFVKGCDGAAPGSGSWRVR